jgi:hypothetical protein
LATRQKNEWIYLSEARRRLCSVFGLYFEMVVDEALAAAIASRRVPLMGVPPGKILRVPIDEQIREPSTSDILSNKLFLRETASRQLFSDFRLVQVDWKALEQFVREIYPATRHASRRPSDGTVIEAFRRSVERHKSDGTRPSRKGHIAELRRDHPGMTEVQYDKAKRDLGEVVPLDWGKPGRIANVLKPREN